MSIVSSSYTLGAAQADGRYDVAEAHTDHLGVVHKLSYRGRSGFDATMAMHAAQLWTLLVEQEIEGALSVDVSPTLQYATKTEFIPVYRQAYRRASDAECARLATWILHRITDGWVTDTQVRNAFGLSAAEWTTLKAKMQTLADHYAAVLAARGE